MAGWRRRDFLKQSLASLGAAAPLLRSRRPALADAKRLDPPLAAQRPKVLCVGAHPDDPESGCGGTLARYAELGCPITIIYLTRGERGIITKSLDEAGAIRTHEAEEACRILAAKPVFAGQIDGATEINKARVQDLAKLLAAEQPDVVFTHWPVDTHMDHQAAGVLTFRAYLAAQPRFQLYFFEVETGVQTLGFAPTDYVDITATREKKKAALFSHKSQNGEQVYRQHHEIMDNFRGREAGVSAAEAFVHLARDSRRLNLPGQL